MKRYIWLFVCMILLGAAYLLEENSKIRTYSQYKENKALRSNLSSDEIKNTMWSLSDKKPVEKTAFLTFDDGPSETTPKVLELLRKYDVKATFFLIGSSITEENLPILKELLKDGHEIGVHTYTHKEQIIYQSVDAYVEDSLRTKETIEQQLGVIPTLFRFPYGSTNHYLKRLSFESIVEQMKELRLTYEDWNVTGEDSIGCVSEYSILKNVKKDLEKHEEPVILLHDSADCKCTVAALPQVLSYIKDSGYRFDTLSHRSEPCQFPESWRK